MNDLNSDYIILKEFLKRIVKTTLSYRVVGKNELQNQKKKDDQS